MRNQLISGVIAISALATVCSPCLAEDAFHVHYRVADIQSDQQIVSGTLFLNVYNTSGEDVFDLLAWIPGPNQVTYDQHQIGVGNLADGAQVEVLDPIIVPFEVTQSEPASGPVQWRLEYSNALGTRQTVDVVGLAVE